MMNNNGVSHRRRAEEHVAAVEAARVDLADLYERGVARPELVGKLQNNMRLGTKLAQVHATLAVAEAVSLNGPRTGSPEPWGLT